MRRILGLLVALCCFSASAIAETYPDRPITLVVPYAAGGPTDTVARIISETMSRELGQRIVIENVAGAGGTLGTARAARAEPDGYTLLLNHTGISTAPTLYPGSLDPLTAFEFIGLVADVPMTIVGRRAFTPNTLQELVSYTVKEGNKVSYAHAGVGSASHLCGVLFAAETGAQPVTIPYKGTGPAMIDLLGSQVDFMCDQTTNTTNQIQAGEVKVYAVTSAQRIPALPNVPAVNEAGLGKMELAIWHGIYAPKGTRDEVTKKLTSALQAALADKTVVERFRQLSAIAVSREEATPAALKSKLTTEIARWRKLLVAEAPK